MDLITTAEVATILGAGASDAFLVNLVNGANAEARGVGRTFERKERAEFVRGYGIDFLFLREPPIISVSEVIVYSAPSDTGGTVIDVAEFIWNEVPEDDDPKLTWTAGRFLEQQRAARVTYVGGFYPAADTDSAHVPRVPEDLRGKMINLVISRFRLGPDATLGASSFSQGDLTINRTDDPALAEFKQALRRYRK